MHLYEEGNFSERVKELLNENKFEVRFSRHMKNKRMRLRNIKIQDIWDNIENPEKLYYAKKRIKQRKNEESYKCYFEMSGQQCHIYGIVFNFKQKYIKITTVIKDRIKLQRRFYHGKN